ncbi:UNVERIFIED_ORG: molybdenum cofactor guanylyltransferase [Bacillus sp. AZ43]
MDPLPPYTAVVLAGGRAARLGGRAKPQLLVGGRPILASVLDAVADAERRVVVGPPQPVPDDVLLVREQPPGGGPVSAIRAGLDAVGTEVVVVLAGDLPFAGPAVVRGLLERLTGDGVMAVDDAGRDQYLLGAWRTAALRAAVTAARGPAPLRRVLAPLDARRWHPEVRPGEAPPWLDCDTPADLARARAIADGHLDPPRPPRPSLVPRFQEPHDPR